MAVSAERFIVDLILHKQPMLRRGMRLVTGQAVNRSHNLGEIGWILDI
jgi:hypothetical protein